MRTRSRVVKIVALLLATVHVTSAELAGVTHGVCAYHGDRAEHHEGPAGSMEHGPSTAHSNVPDHNDASEAPEFHCTASCCCSVVAAPAAFGSVGLLQALVDSPQRGSNVVAGREALPRDPHILPFANAPPVIR